MASSEQNPPATGPGDGTGERRVRGMPLSGGMAIGRVCLFDDRRHQDVPEYDIDPSHAEAEVSRLEEALAGVSRELDDVRARVAGRLGHAEAGIFAAQKIIVEDPVVTEEMRYQIRAHLRNAERSIRTVLDAHEATLSALDDEYLRERASDIGEVRRRLLNNLGQAAPGFSCAGQCRRGRHRIVIAEELTPTLTVSINANEVMGFVTERGGTNSHAAILARALGIPAVSGIRAIHNAVACGTRVAINGDTGEVIIEPGEATMQELARRAAATPTVAIEKPVENLEVMANITLGGEVTDALAMEAEGIGLYRTEFEFIAAGTLLSEDEQFQRYAAVVSAMGGRVTTFRMLDAGGDKPLPELEIAHEENPVLGLRGSRLLIRYPQLFRDQARAIARASELGPVRVMFPMVVDVDQFRRLRDQFRHAATDLPSGRIAYGVMLEVPSAALQAEEILAEADFASVGTNDLAQYLFAVDRNNELVADDYPVDHPVLWGLIGVIAGVAARHGRPLSICGEMAGEPAMVAQLLACGIRSVSCSPRAIPAVRKAASARVAGGQWAGHPGGGGEQVSG